APNGTLALTGKLSGRGADFSADAQSLGEVAALDAALGTGGFSGARSLRLRGPGDLVIGTAASESIDARSVALTADQGAVVVNGTIVSHGISGGSITLSARDEVVVNGVLDARPATSGEMNGSLELRSSQGGVLIGTAATLAAYDPSVGVQSDADGA